MEKKRSQATVYDTPEYELLQANNAEIDVYNIKP